jgi:hypothetical protein
MWDLTAFLDNKPLSQGTNSASVQETVCRALGNFSRLSTERLPLGISTQLLLWPQLGCLVAAE